MKAKTLSISMICLLSFILIALSFESDLLVEVDYFILEELSLLRVDWLMQVMHFFAIIGSTGAVILLTAVLLGVLFFMKVEWKELLFTASVMAVTGMLNTLIKQLVSRIRPEDFMVVELSTYSFPSGHSMGAMSFYGVLLFLIWKRIDRIKARLLVLLFSTFMIVGMGLSRVYLGVHYATDVIGGFLLSGAIVSFFIWYFYERKKR